MKKTDSPCTRLILTCCACGFKHHTFPADLALQHISISPLPVTIEACCSNCSAELGVDYFEPGVPNLVLDHFIEWDYSCPATGDRGRSALIPSHG